MVRKNIIQCVAPQGPLAKAIQYALNQWPALNTYLDNGELMIDNNVIENAMQKMHMSDGTRFSSIFTPLSRLKRWMTSEREPLVNNTVNDSDYGATSIQGNSNIPRL